MSDSEGGYGDDDLDLGERNCPSCLSTELEYNSNTGTFICGNCGVATNDDVITNELEFYQEGNAKRAVGSFYSFPTVKKDRSAKESVKKNEIVYDPNEQIQMTDELTDRALSIMNIIATKPSINMPDAVKPALFYYKIAFKAQIYKSRCISHVCAACLYIICRLRKTGHLLIDFAEAIQADVFLLGNIYLSIVRFAHISMPLIDPSLLLERYGVKAGLGPQYRDICHTAARIIGRMNRDYINTGRRPNGLCGAAILVSARLHGVDLSIKKMVQVVKISRSILMQRLNDVSNTKSASLSLEDFFSDKLEKIVSEDPPSYQKSRSIYKKRATLEMENKWLSSDVIDQVMKANQDIEVFQKLQETIKMGIDYFQETNTLLTVQKRSRGRPKKKRNEENETYKTPEKPQTVFCYENTPVIKKLDESAPLISDFEDDEEVQNAILSTEEIAMRAKAFDEKFKKFYDSKIEKQNRKELEYELSNKRISKGPRRRNAGLSELVQKHLLKNIDNSKIKNSRSVKEIMSNIKKDAGDTLETTEDFISMCLDPKKRNKLIDMKVPEHIQKKYDEKNKQNTISPQKRKTSDLSNVNQDDLNINSENIQTNNSTAINNVNDNYNQEDGTYNGLKILTPSNKAKTSEISPEKQKSRSRKRDSKVKKISESPFTIKMPHTLPEESNEPKITGDSIDEFVTSQLLHLVEENIYDQISDQNNSQENLSQNDININESNIIDKIETHTSNNDFDYSLLEQLNIQNFSYENKEDIYLDKEYEQENDNDEYYNDEEQETYY